MKLLIESAMVFFATLMAAAVVALAGPAGVELVGAPTPSSAGMSAPQLVASCHAGDTQGAIAHRPGR